MIYIGTSGWHYDHWRGPFYPPDLPPRRFLAYYQQFLSAVEINNSFYRLPSAAAVSAWREGAPTGFRFAVKASRLITHLKRLQGTEEAVGTFLARLSLLGPTLGPILFQLPPRFRFHPERLATFLASLPTTYRYAMEMRDPSWLVPEAYALLARFRVAFCLYEIAGFLSPLEVTTDLVYIRLHGPGGAYQGSYPDATLHQWAERCRGWQAQGREVYCFFDNDEAGYAVRNALTLQQFVEAG